MLTLNQFNVDAKIDIHHFMISFNILFNVILQANPDLSTLVDSNQQKNWC